MLRNHNFEGITSSGAWTRDTHNGQQYGEIFTPEAWTTWFEEGPYRRPECKIIPRQAPFLDPLRIREGDWAWQAFTKFGRQHAGLYQVVTGLERGQTYRFSAWAHAWSAHPDVGPGNPMHDGHCSSGVGCDGYYKLLKDVQRDHPLNGNSVNDAIGNFAFCVGVSFGDPDPFADAVQWGDAACIYNEFAQVPPVEFIAQADSAIVYLRAVSLWQFEVSDAYWDDAELVAVGAPSGCRGDPRVQYARTYVVWPKGASLDRKLELVHEYPDNTQGPSMDDSMLGNLDDRTVIVPEPDTWGGKQAVVDFRDEHYPGVKLEFVDEEPPADDILLCQCDDRWKNRKFGER